MSFLGDEKQYYSRRQCVLMHGTTGPEVLAPYTGYLIGVHSKSLDANGDQSSEVLAWTRDHKKLFDQVLLQEAQDGHSGECSVGSSRPPKLMSKVADDVGPQAPAAFLLGKGKAGLPIGWGG
ncbi:unnamed protein product [Diplocarpon coronariae]